MNPLTTAALQYLAEGHHLLALRGKRPNPRYHPEWSWDASIRPSDDGAPLTDKDIADLDAIFEDRTTTGLAILIPEHVLVADIDTEAAAELWMSLTTQLPSHTRVCRTPNGLHCWFLSPGADASVWLGGRTLLLKGYGGYVAAPPSAHFNEDGVQDGVYEWLGDDGVAPYIDWLPEEVAGALATARAVASLTPVRFSDEDRTSMHWEMKDGRLLMHPAWNIEGLLKAIREAADGNQNNVIAWAALTAQEEGVPFAYGKPLLLQAALDGGHPRNRALSTINGAYKRRRGG